MDYSAKLQSYYRETARLNAEAIPVPPFTLFLSATDRSQHANFAIPDTPIYGEISEAVHVVETTCEAYECRAHFRFLHSWAPELPLALQACGYYEADSWSLLVCTPESYQPAPMVPGLEMVIVSHHSSLEEVKEGWNQMHLDTTLMPIWRQMNKQKPFVRV